MSTLPVHIDLQTAIQKITSPWSPMDLAVFNDNVIRLAKFEGEYHWHSHEADELFLIWSGKVTIHIRNMPDLILGAGDIGVVPRGIEHCPRGSDEAYAIMIEPRTLRSEGI